ncbi:hypothetical protein KW797_03525 [Candidatus Parcubacteria bacterium]|nr:hypothetical protein [Candidatus Parcubacteria bacterium]
MMKDSELVQKLQVLQKRREGLDRSLADKRAELTSLKREFARLQEEAKTLFGVSSPEEMFAKADADGASAKLEFEKLESALTLFERGNLAGAARVLDMEVSLATDSSD